MNTSSDAIPDVEKLLRDVLRTLFENTFGSAWLAGLSSGVRQAAKKAAELALKNRPHEVLRDDWDAVGLGEIAVAVRSTWPDIGSELLGIWRSLEEAGVDLDRLLAYRGKRLHAVGPPAAQFQDAEIGAVVLRLRVGFEALRRRLANDAGEWWPYIEAVHSNIPEFCMSRPTSAASATVTAGDLVWFEVVAVHPQGSQDRLRYRLNGAGPVANEVPDTGWVPDARFQVEVPRGRIVAFHLFVADVDDPKNNEEWVCSCKVRPT